jgi:hypothetical protein
MSKFLGGTGAALGVKIVTGFAIAAAASVLAAEVVVTGSANPADWGRQVSHKVMFAPATAPAASGQQPADTVTGNSERTATTAGASADSSVATNDKLKDSPKVSRPNTTWFPEPNDPAIVAAQTRFIPKP